MTKYTDSEIEKIAESVSLLEYFQYLESKGEVKFNKKYGKDYYFISEGSKYSVSNDKFYDFKTGKGGKIIKAVMQFENKKWIDAVEFLKDFGNSTITDSLKKEFIEKRKRIDEDLSKNRSETKIIRSIVPNNQKLIEYFESRGISKDVLKQNVKQIHYQINDKQYFGAGLLNQSGGYEIRNPMMKSKIGTNNFSLIEGKNNKEMLVFEGMTDMLSFLQLLKNQNREQKATLISLNSVNNVDKFISSYEKYKGNIYLILDGDDEGNRATKQIKESLKFAKIKDIRHLYNINNVNLSQYLKKQKLNNEVSKDTKIEKKDIQIDEKDLKLGIIKKTIPENIDFLEYFKKQHISTEVLKENALEIHYRNNGKEHKGIGFENRSGGYELRNSKIKLRLGNDDITIHQGNTNREVIVVENMVDMLSFLQLLKNHNKEQKATLISLNSVDNVGKFISSYEKYKGNITLILNASDKADLAVKNIKESLKFAKIKDVRHLYNINNGDFNQYFKKNVNREIIEERNIRNGWYLHHNEFSSENNVYDFSGAKVTSKLIKTIESIDKRERKKEHFYDYTFIKYQNGEEEEAGYLQISVGDKFAEQENKKWFAFLLKEIQELNAEQEKPTLFYNLGEIAEKRKEAIEKTYLALHELNAKKIKTPATLKGILKYDELHNQLLNKSKKFNVIELDDFISKSNKIIQSKSKKEFPKLQGKLEERQKNSKKNDDELERENENKTFYKLRDEEDLLTKDNSRKNRR